MPIISRLLSRQEEVSIGDFTFPLEPIISVSFRKNIVKTKVPGRRGTVKEYMETEDAIINIEAVFTPDELQRIDPFGLGIDEFSGIQEWVEKIKDLFDQNKRQIIYSNLCSSLGIIYVVLERISFPGPQGSDAQAVSLQLLEDGEILDFE